MRLIVVEYSPPKIRFIHQVIIILFTYPELLFFCILNQYLTIFPLLLRSTSHSRTARPLGAATGDSAAILHASTLSLSLSTHFPNLSPRSSLIVSLLHLSPSTHPLIRLRVSRSDGLFTAAFACRRPSSHSHLTRSTVGWSIRTSPT